MAEDVTLLRGNERGRKLAARATIAENAQKEQAAQEPSSSAKTTKKTRASSQWFRLCTLYEQMGGQNVFRVPRDFLSTDEAHELGFYPHDKDVQTFSRKYKDFQEGKLKNDGYTKRQTTGKFARIQEETIQFILRYKAENFIYPRYDLIKENALRINNSESDFRCSRDWIVKTLKMAKSRKAENKEAPSERPETSKSETSKIKANDEHSPNQNSSLPQPKQTRATAMTEPGQEMTRTRRASLEWFRLCTLYEQMGGRIRFKTVRHFLSSDEARELGFHPSNHDMQTFRRKYKLFRNGTLSNNDTKRQTDRGLLPGIRDGEKTEQQEVIQDVTDVSKTRDDDRSIHGSEERNGCISHGAISTDVVANSITANIHDSSSNDIISTAHDSQSWSWSSGVIADIETFSYGSISSSLFHTEIVLSPTIYSGNLEKRSFSSESLQPVGNKYVCSGLRSTTSISSNISSHRKQPTSIGGTSACEHPRQKEHQNLASVNLSCQMSISSASIFTSQTGGFISYDLEKISFCSERHLSEVNLVHGKTPRSSVTFSIISRNSGDHQKQPHTIIITPFDDSFLHDDGHDVGEDHQKAINQTLPDFCGDSGSYSGVILCSTGFPDGLGRMKYEDGRVYEGDWQRGQWHGHGRVSFKNGDFYGGGFCFGQRHGCGVFIWSDGRVYNGCFLDDKHHGEGILKWPDGGVYEGEFVQGEHEGYGQHTFIDGGYYVGSWVNGKYEGYGEYHWFDGRTYKGEWKGGMAHGQGIETYSDGRVRHDGKWLNNEPDHVSGHGSTSRTTSTRLNGPRVVLERANHEERMIELSQNDDNEVTYEKEGNTKRPSSQWFQLFTLYEKGGRQRYKSIKEFLSACQEAQRLGFDGSDKNVRVFRRKYKIFREGKLHNDRASKRKTKTGVPWIRERTIQFILQYNKDHSEYPSYGIIRAEALRIKNETATGGSFGCSDGWISRTLKATKLRVENEKDVAWKQQEVSEDVTDNSNANEPGPSHATKEQKSSDASKCMNSNDVANMEKRTTSFTAASTTTTPTPDGRSGLDDHRNELRVSLDSLGSFSHESTSGGNMIGDGHFEDCYSTDGLDKGFLWDENSEEEQQMSHAQIPGYQGWHDFEMKPDDMQEEAIFSSLYAEPSPFDDDIELGLLDLPTQNMGLGTFDSVPSVPVIMEENPHPEDIGVSISASGDEPIGEQGDLNVGIFLHDRDEQESSNRNVFRSSFGLDETWPFSPKIGSSTVSIHQVKSEEKVGEDGLGWTNTCNGDVVVNPMVTRPSELSIGNGKRLLVAWNSEEAEPKLVVIALLSSFRSQTGEQKEEIKRSTSITTSAAAIDGSRQVWEAAIVGQEGGGGPASEFFGDADDERAVTLYASIMSQETNEDCLGLQRILLGNEDCEGASGAEESKEMEEDMTPKISSPDVVSTRMKLMETAGNSGKNTGSDGHHKRNTTRDENKERTKPQEGEFDADSRQNGILQAGPPGVTGYLRPASGGGHRKQTTLSNVKTNVPTQGTPREQNNKPEPPDLRALASCTPLLLPRDIVRAEKDDNTDNDFPMTGVPKTDAIDISADISEATRTMEATKPEGRGAHDDRSVGRSGTPGRPQTARLEATDANHEGFMMCCARAEAMQDKVDGEEKKSAKNTTRTNLAIIGAAQTQKRKECCDNGVVGLSIARVGPQTSPPEATGTVHEERMVQRARDEAIQNQVGPNEKKKRENSGDVSKISMTRARAALECFEAKSPRQRAGSGDVTQNSTLTGKQREDGDDIHDPIMEWEGLLVATNSREVFDSEYEGHQRKGKNQELQAKTKGRFFGFAGKRSAQRQRPGPGVAPVEGDNKKPTRVLPIFHTHTPHLVYAQQQPQQQQQQQQQQQYMSDSVDETTRKESVGILKDLVPRLDPGEEMPSRPARRATCRAPTLVKNADATTASHKGSENNSGYLILCGERGQCRDDHQCNVGEEPDDPARNHHANDAKKLEHDTRMTEPDHFRRHIQQNDDNAVMRTIKASAQQIEREAFGGEQQAPTTLAVSAIYDSDQNDDAQGSLVMGGHGHSLGNSSLIPNDQQPQQPANRKRSQEGVGRSIVGAWRVYFSTDRQITAHRADLYSDSEADDLTPASSATATTTGSDDLVPSVPLIGEVVREVPIATPLTQNEHGLQLMVGLEDGSEQRKLKIIQTLFVLVLLGAILAAVLSATLGIQLDNTGSQSTPPSHMVLTNSPTITSQPSVRLRPSQSPSQSMVPTPAPTTGFEATLAARIQSVRPTISFVNPHSPQSRALRWLARDPYTLQIPLSDSSLVQRFALAALAFATNGDIWIWNTSWLAPVNECYWTQLGCHRTTLAVESIVLKSSGLSGSLPPEIGLLGQLRELNLFDNKLSGAVPTEVGELTELTSLSLGNNDFASTIATELGRLSLLHELSLDSNQFSGSIPTIMGQLTKLTDLRLGNNNITGPVPTQLGLMTNLLRLDVSANRLVSTVPTETGRLAKLTRLDMQTNDLEGFIPTELGNMTDLTWLSIGSNKFSGAVPSEVGNLIQLRALIFAGNILEGSVPTELAELTNLDLLELFANDLTGKTPLSLCSFVTPMVDCGEIECGCCRDQHERICG